MTDKDNMREEFEAWAASKGFNRDEIRCLGYEFEIWQAAKESSRKELEAAKQRIAELGNDVNRWQEAAADLGRCFDGANKKFADLNDRMLEEEEAHAQLQARCYDQGGTFSNVFQECPTLKAEKEALEKKLATQQALIVYAQENVTSVMMQAKLKLDATATEELTKLLAAAEQRGFDDGMDTILTGSWKIQLAAARQQGFEEGKQAGRDELQKELSEMEPVMNLRLTAEDAPRGTPLIPRPLPPQVKGG